MTAKFRVTTRIYLHYIVCYWSRRRTWRVQADIRYTYWLRLEGGLEVIVVWRFGLSCLIRKLTALIDYISWNRCWWYTNLFRLVTVKFRVTARIFLRWLVCYWSRRLYKELVDIRYTYWLRLGGGLVVIVVLGLKLSCLALIHYRILSLLLLFTRFFLWNLVTVLILIKLLSFHINNQIILSLLFLRLSILELQ
jgi:hypothetical protein